MVRIIVSMLFCWSTLVVAGCSTTPKFSNDVRVIYFEEKMAKGKPVGLAEGEDCAYEFKVPFTSLSGRSGTKRLRRAIDSARKLKRSSMVNEVSEKIIGKRDSEQEEPKLRYMTNVVIEYDSAAFFIFERQCVLVSGNGYI